MKFTLTDYQADAAGRVLAGLQEARSVYRDQKSPQTVSLALAAPTGAGKTVIAAAVVEALFTGSDRFACEADPGALVIWFSDDPSLNKQSRHRLMQASEKLTLDRLEVIQPPFARRALDPGKVYFLNTQRLSSSSRLTRGYIPKTSSSNVTLHGFQTVAPPDELAWNIWQTIANTIKTEHLTVYLILDEAHRGFNTRQSSDRDTIVRRLIAGDQTGHPMPIVLGISATIERFRVAMKSADSAGARHALADVDIEPARVMASGLLKDTVILDIPGEDGDLGVTLAAEGARRLKESTIRWKRYATQQGETEPVVPLLVFQIPNTPVPDDIGAALDAINVAIPDLTAGSVRHVLGEHRTEVFGQWKVDWIEPERVQEATEVRVLVAKDAISTGWDCPRAEVLVSFRPAKDQTHIAQLLGRMVRSPLARRVPGNDRLNSVDCILPYFDRTTAGNVVRYMTGEIEGLPPIGTGRVLLDGRELEANGEIGGEVWAVFDALPTETAPQRGARPVKRLVALAQALATDGLQPTAIADATKKVHDWLDGYSKVHSDDVDDATAEVRAVHIETLSGNRGEAGVKYSTRTVVADDRAIRIGLDDAKSAFGSDIAMSYVNHLVDSSAGDDDDLRDAYVRTSALGLVGPLREKVDHEADLLVASLFADHRVALLGLSDERQQEYDEIRSLTTEPQLSALRRPRNRLEDFVTPDGDAASLLKKHLLSDGDGDFPVASLNGWEQEIVALELGRPDAVAWYRNPSHNGVDSLAIAYRDSKGDWRLMHPDFVFFSRVGDQVLPSIVDPHGQHLEDSLVKLQGLAHFTEKFGEAFHRIDATIKDGSTWRVLDLKRSVVREAIGNHAASVVDLYNSPVATDYR